ncbi:MAG TPA: glycosyltransferase [Chloroflexota bacterium]|nr:glycosyltransferase [Chloroflexota bacterium]
MKILYVTPQPPWPPRQGTALRNYHLLRALAGRHRVDLLTFSAPPDDEAALRRGPLGDLCGRIDALPPPPRPPAARLAGLLRGEADMEGRLRSPAFAARLRRRLAEGGYDAVQLEGFEVAGYLLGPAALRAEAEARAPWRRAPAIVFDDHNAEYRLQATAAAIDSRRPRRWPRALYSYVQSGRLRAREALYAAGADACLAVSPEDAAALEAIVPGLGAVVVANGVAVAAAPPPAPGPRPLVLFTGKLDYRPNVDAGEWLVREILPLVRARVPDVRFVLAGRDPAPAVRRLAGPDVEVTGALTDDGLTALRASAWVEAVPLRMGSGVRFKALEAMAAGVPLVATTLGAAGTGAEHGRQALIADDAPGFAAAVCDLLTRPERRRALAAAAHALAAARHDWSRITPRLLAVYERLERPAQAPVSLIATVRDERASVDAWLASIRGLERAPDECVFVDGGSTDGTAERLRAAGAAPARGTGLTVLSHPGANISRGRNLAVAAAGGEIVAATDAGVRLAPAWLARLVRPLEGDPTLGAAGGFFVSDPASVWELALGATTLPDVGEIDPRRFLPSSRSVAFRREAWHQAGGYPEWLDYCEDLLFDFALRRVAGPIRFVPRATVRFRPRGTPGAYFRQYYRYARGDGKADLWRRRHALRYGAYLAGLVLLATGLGRGQRRRRTPARLLLILGGVAYLRRPFIRLTQASASGRDRLLAAPLIPLARALGDVAKMLGYPAGLWWRWRAGREGSSRTGA